MRAADVVLLQAQLDAANARAERAEGQFRALDLEHNALKAKHRQALLGLEDLRVALRTAREHLGYGQQGRREDAIVVVNAALGEAG